jgi:hypothetical protein
LAELVHDADLEDDKFRRVEGFGIDQIFKGRAKQGLSDQQILTKAFERFDAVYAQFKRVMKNFSISETAYGTPVNGTRRIRDVVSYFFRRAIQGRPAVQARQRAEGAR